MSDRFSLLFCCLLFIFFAALPVSAQKLPQAPKPEAAPSVQEDQEPKPEPPRKVLNVEITNDLLSVELENVDFGAVIKAVADKAGFKIEGRGDVFNRKLNTRFTDIEVERGVLRLLTLVKESNYMLYYDTKGLISKLEILGIESGKAPAAAAPAATTRQPMRPPTVSRQPAVSTEPPQLQSPARVAPTPRTRVLPPVPRRRPVISRPASPLRPAVQPSATPETPAAEENSEEEEPVSEIPYVAPQPRLAPAPVK
ncbi:MAG: hypothetical protein HZB62_05425 [Nitrospirae bacterium]|nr:hypothetical protein [Nitrospirota bacterium]